MRALQNGTTAGKRPARYAMRQFERNNAALAAARNGSIILMHDGGGNRTETVEALPIIIHTLLQRGFKLVTVNQLINDTHDLSTAKLTNSSPVATIDDQPEAWADTPFTRQKLA